MYSDNLWNITVIRQMSAPELELSWIILNYINLQIKMFVNPPINKFIMIATIR